MIVKHPNPQVSIVTSGKSKKITFNNLSRNLRAYSEIYEISDKEVYLGVISHQTLVLFATEFADYALQNYTKKIIPEAETCIRLIRKWLEDRESVSNEELRAAAMLLLLLLLMLLLMLLLLLLMLLMLLLMLLMLLLILLLLMLLEWLEKKNF